MKHIAFIGHSYHRKTRSFDFFADILEKSFDVSYFYDDTWAGGTPLDISEVNVSEYDIVVLWQQINYTLHPEINGHPNVILVPMFDCHAQNLGGFQRFCKNDNFKLINFCRAQHEACVQYGLTSLSVQYFPNPEDFDPIRNFEELVCFFWPRRNEINWNTVKCLISEASLSRLFFHTAPDRGFPTVAPSENETAKYQINISEWFNTKEELLKVLRQANVYFAPRLYEGIGLSFIEAMAMGMCVVAPNTPTMNEYITHRVNGLLYDPHHPGPLDFSELRRMGTRARQSVEGGHKRWLESIEVILKFIDSESEIPPAMEYQAPDLNCLTKISSPSTTRNTVSLEDEPDLYLQASQYGGLRTQGKFKTNTEDRPLITIATVTYNADTQLPPTLASVFEQTYDNIELIVVDGQSEDNTLEIVKRNEAYIDLWISGPDNGPFDAMNKAAGLARGNWILFLNAGDWFTDNDILSGVIRITPWTADIIYGHHYYRHIGGNLFWHKANEFEWTHETLEEGSLTNDWVRGIPAHQSTLTRVSLLTDVRYDTEHYKYAADHDFLFKMKADGRTFHHTDLTIAVYNSGGFSWQNAADCMHEQWAIARKFGPVRKVNKFYKKRLKGFKIQKQQLPLSFSKEWHAEESCFGGWLRWLPKAGHIGYRCDKSGQYLLTLQTYSLRPDNKLEVALNGQLLFKKDISTRSLFLGPKPIFLDEREHRFEFRAQNEPSMPSLSDPRLLGIAVKNFTVVEATLTNKLSIYSKKLSACCVDQTIGRLKSRLKSTFMFTPHFLKTYVIIWKSGLFSKTYYLDQYPEILRGTLKDPIQHYILKGASERKNPNPLFDTGFYLDTNPDVAASGMNPLYHYITCGSAERREPSPNISMAEYMQKNPSLDPSRTNALSHYLKS